MKTDGEPFDRRVRGWSIEQLNEQAWFAFNYAQPSGILLLSPPRAAKYLKQLDQGLDPLTCRVPLEPPLRTLTAWLHIVNVCNLSCPHCYIPQLRRTDSNDEIAKASISADTLELSLKSLIIYCRENQIHKLHIKFAGGEPTLSVPLLRKACEYACAAKGPLAISFAILTNGSNCSTEFLQLVKAYCINVSISLDGLADEHDRIRGFIGGRKRVSSWSVAVKTIDCLQQVGVAPYILFTITSANYNDFLPLTTWVHNRGLGIRASLVRLPLTPSDDTQDRMACSIIESYRDIGSSMPLSLSFANHAKFAEWNLLKRKFLACGSCRNYFSIDSHGAVASCQMTINRPLGNLKIHSLSEIIFKSKGESALKTLVHPEQRVGPCTDCRYFHTCSGGCPQHTQFATGSISNKSPWCRLLGKLLPEYIKANAVHLWRRACALAEPANE